MALPKVSSVKQLQKQLSVANRPIMRHIKKGIAASKAEQRAFVKGMGAKQDRAFGKITQGASNRGLLFSGIPLGEQAEYTATEYLPALAAGKASFAKDRSGLRMQGLELNKGTLAQALQLRENQLNRYWQAVEAQKQREAAERAARAARAAAAASSFRPTLGGGGGGGGGNPLNQPLSKSQQRLYNQVFLRSDGGEWSDQDLVRDYNATKISAGYGNQRDKQKLVLYHSVRPDLFGNTSIPGQALANSPTF